MGIAKLLGVETQNNLRLFGSLNVLRIKKLFNTNFFERLPYRTIEKIYSYGGWDDPGDTYSRDTDEYYNDIWSARTDIPSPGRLTAACTIYNRGYIFGGEFSDPPLDYGTSSDTDEYIPLADAWTSKTDVPSPGRVKHVALNISGKGYIWSGYSDDISSYLRDNDKFDPRDGSGTWTAMPELPSPARYEATATSVSSKGYIFGGGTTGTLLGDNDEYNPLGSVWTSKETIPYPTARSKMASFTISSLGYLCGGYNSEETPNAFHELDAYDPSENSWTLKADMTYYRRDHAAVGKGSLGFEFGGAEEGEGLQQQSTNAYDPSTDSWEAKTNMPAAKSCHDASTLSYEVSPGGTSSGTIDETEFRLYSFGGNAMGGFLSDNDEYNPDTWTAKTGLPDYSRDKLSATNVEWKGYAFAGEIMMGLRVDTYEYDTNDDVWASKTDMPSPGRTFLASTTVDSKCYVFGGQDDAGEIGNMLRDTDEYDTSDSWTSKTDTPAPGRYGLSASTILSAGYIFGGSISGATYLQDTDKYDPDAWTSQSDMPSPGRERFAATTVSNKIYAFAGIASGPTFLTDTDEYDPDSWTSKSSVYSPGRGACGGGHVGSKGYLCGGDSTSSDLDGWLQDNEEYNPSEDSWSAKTDMPSPARKWHAIASIDVSTYSGTGAAERVYIFGGVYDSGEGDAFMLDTEEYDGSSWTSKTNMPSPARGYLAGSNISEKAYVYGGEADSGLLLDTDEYSSTDSWANKTNMPSPARNRLAASTISSKGYVYGGEIPSGETGSPLQDTDEYDPVAGELNWTSKTDMPLPARRNHAAVTISSKGYVFGGYDNTSSYITDTDEYDPAAGESNWTTMDSMSIATDLLAASAIDSKGYTYGGRYYDGESDVPMRDTNEFDPAAGESNWTSDTDMPTPARQEHTASTIDSHGLVAAGYDGTNYLSDCDYFDPLGGESAWSSLSDIPSPARYGSPASCTLEV